MRYRKEDDISLLLPSFRRRVEKLLERMRARGFTPVLRDGYRTPKQAAANARRGTGIRQSMHCYGAAADIICGHHGWNHPEFFRALGQEAERLGLIWGGRWRSRDFPHVQAVRVRDQNALRALPESQWAPFVAGVLKERGHYA